MTRGRTAPAIASSTVPMSAPPSGISSSGSYGPPASAAHRGPGSGLAVQRWTIAYRNAVGDGQRPADDSEKRRREIGSSSHRPARASSEADRGCRDDQATSSVRLHHRTATRTRRCDAAAVRRPPVGVPASRPTAALRPTCRQRGPGRHVSFSYSESPVQRPPGREAPRRTSCRSGAEAVGGTEHRERGGCAHPRSFGSAPPCLTRSATGTRRICEPCEHLTGTILSATPARRSPYGTGTSSLSVTSVTL